MKLQIKDLQVEICEKTGKILSVQGSGRPFSAGMVYPLFTLYLLDEAGKRHSFDADTAAKVCFSPKTQGCLLTYENIGGLALSACVEFTEGADELLHGTLSVQNHTDMVLEMADFIKIAVPSDLVKNGGSSVILTPFTEGTIIEDMYLRDQFHGTTYRDLGYTFSGIVGRYPNVANFQMMAYYSEKGGLYVAAHDDAGNIKQLEAFAKDDHICLLHQVMAGGLRGDWKMGYDLVLGSFSGDWHDAMDIYRAWFESSRLCPALPEENQNLPDWIGDAPIVLILPIRGSGSDHDPMLPSCYYPYENAAKYINMLSKKLHSRILALMCHWEGTAPWAPPYVWPPYGSEESFQNAVRRMHEAGNLVGVYCSGIGWTTKSYIDTDKDFSARFAKEGIEACISVSPEGETKHIWTMTGIREAYEMCPAVQKVKDIVADEVAKIAAADVDYCQFFDQDWGGLCRPCYAKDHGHPLAPGKWLVEEMHALQEGANARIRALGKSMILGTEGAAAEPFVDQLPFNDLRFFKGYYYGKPVPAWAYLTHAYTANFAGNGCNISMALDIMSCPEFLPFTIGYAFCEGAILTGVLGSSGRLHWCWNCDENVYGLPENQEELWTYLANLNDWRKGNGKAFLLYGRMEKPEPLAGLGTFSLLRPDGSAAEYADLLTAKWRYRGKTVQFVLNFLYTEKTFSVGKDVLLYETADGAGRRILANTSITLPPLTAYMLEF